MKIFLKIKNWLKISSNNFKELIMKNINPFLFPALFVFALFMSISCETCDVLFKSGVWVGILIILSCLSLIIYLIAYNLKEE